MLNSISPVFFPETQQNCQYAERTKQNFQPGNPRHLRTSCLPRPCASELGA
ncbi:unnamed protein product [Penicillium camemberti]|uniref:Str. FM013 n=1 Tax=Penicillium camemberti (strain FM 013) TaxID=1429867 RepID=A0A0G4P9U2_PENC3|nr:unnamed protein product [Penicillium camemberti]